MGELVTQDFLEIEAKDEQQMLAEYEGRVIEETTYTVKGQTAISYQGIKHIANKLGHIKILPESIKAEYIEKPEEMWVATVVAINEKYGTQLPGAGENSLYMETREGTIRDPFARRKAISKATRNAIRAVIPEAMIIKYLDDVKAGKNGGKRKERPKPQKTPEKTEKQSRKVGPPPKKSPRKVKADAKVTSKPKANLTRGEYTENEQNVINTLLDKDIRTNKLEFTEKDTSVWIQPAIGLYEKTRAKLDDLTDDEDHVIYHEERDIWEVQL